MKKTKDEVIMDEAITVAKNVTNYLTGTKRVIVALAVHILYEFFKETYPETFSEAMRIDFKFATKKGTDA